MVGGEGEESPQGSGKASMVPGGSLVEEQLILHADGLTLSLKPGTTPICLGTMLPHVSN